MIKKGINDSTEFNNNDLDLQAQSERIADDFLAFFNEWHSYGQPYDDAMDAWLHQSYAIVKNKRSWFDFKSQPHFSPSSANNDDRELYVKVLKGKRDKEEGNAVRRRWTALGTVVGDLVQRELLLAERHFTKFTGGKEPRFTIERTPAGYPAFEDFIKTMKVITHKGKKFSLFGTGDGIMRYVADDGEILRVGLEVKSKQTTYAQTSYNSMKAPKEDHVKQCVAYSVMYDVDFFVILYVNTSKKGWFMTEEDMKKYPDVRAFGVYITDSMKNELLDKFAGVLEAVEQGKPPKLDISKLTFNNFKGEIANALTQEEWDDIEVQLTRINASRMPQWLKRQYNDAVADLKGRVNNG